MTPIDSAPGFHPGEPQEGPVPMRGVSSQAGLAAVRHGVVAPATPEITVGTQVRSKASFRIGRVVEVGTYYDGSTRLRVDYGTGITSCPVSAVEVAR